MYSTPVWLVFIAVLASLCRAEHHSATSWEEHSAAAVRRWAAAGALPAGCVADIANAVAIFRLDAGLAPALFEVPCASPDAGHLTVAARPGSAGWTANAVVRVGHGVGPAATAQTGAGRVFMTDADEFTAEQHLTREHHAVVWPVRKHATAFSVGAFGDVININDTAGPRDAPQYRPLRPLESPNPKRCFTGTGATAIMAYYSWADAHLKDARGLCDGSPMSQNAMGGCEMQLTVNMSSLVHTRFTLNEEHFDCTTSETSEASDSKVRCAAPRRSYRDSPFFARPQYMQNAMKNFERNFVPFRSVATRCIQNVVDINADYVSTYCWDSINLKQRPCMVGTGFFGTRYYLAKAMASDDSAQGEKMWYLNFGQEGANNAWVAADSFLSCFLK